jgi:hypothetical protein
MTKKEKEILLNELEAKKKSYKQCKKYYMENPNYCDGQTVALFEDMVTDFEGILKRLGMDIKCGGKKS